MKFKKHCAVALTILSALSASACGVTETRETGVLLALPAAAQPMSYEQCVDTELTEYREKANAFAAKFAEKTYAGQSYAVSPVSIYMALTLAAQCADGNTAAELYSALGVTQEQAERNFPLLYRSINVRYENPSLSHSYDITNYGTARSVDDKVKNANNCHGVPIEYRDIGELTPTNSIWIDKNCGYKTDCIDDLAQKYFCFPYSVDFENDNTAANRAVREFVRDKSNGLIDQDFELSPQTVFALINTFYMKDVWFDGGDDIPITDEQYTFRGKDSEKRTRLMIGHYLSGRAIAGDGYVAFYTSTYNGNKIKFIVASEGCTIDQAFTASNIAAVNNTDFYENSRDDENKIIYETRCLFPSFTASFDDDVSPVLKAEFGINDLFSAQNCDLGALTDARAYCSKVKHVTNLKVDRKGIEGAAVTVTEFAGSGTGDEEWTTVYEDFTVDRSYGFIVTDKYDTTLFAGVMTDI